MTPEPAAEATTTTAQPVPTAEASTVTEPAASSPAEASKSTESVTTTSTSDTESTADTDSTVEAGPSTTSEATGWTAAQDSLLVAMKARGNSFKQIRQVMPEKTKVQMKERLQHVGALMDIFTTTMKVDVKGKGKAVESDTDEEDSIGGKGKGKETDDETDVETDGEASIKGKGKGKADGGERSKGKGKGKGKAKKAKNQKKVRIAVPEDSTDDEDTDSSAGSAIDPDYWPTGPDDEEFALRGHLKIVEVNSDEDDPIELRGRPVVYMQPEDHLDQEEVGSTFTSHLTLANLCAVDGNALQADEEERRAQVDRDWISLFRQDWQANATKGPQAHAQEHLRGEGGCVGALCFALCRKRSCSRMTLERQQ